MDADMISAMRLTQDGRRVATSNNTVFTFALLARQSWRVGLDCGLRRANE